MEIPANEKQCLHALQHYRILDTSAEKALDDLTESKRTVADLEAHEQMLSMCA